MSLKSNIALILYNPQRNQDKKIKKTFYWRTSANYDFKSNYIFYEIFGNVNRKMLIQVYIN